MGKLYGFCLSIAYITRQHQFYIESTDSEIYKTIRQRMKYKRTILLTSNAWISFSCCSFLSSCAHDYIISELTYWCPSNCTSTICSKFRWCNQTATASCITWHSYTKCVTKQEHTFESIVCCLPPTKEVLSDVFSSFPLVHTTLEWA